MLDFINSFQIVQGEPVKLKLEEQNEVTILSVTEGVSEKDCAILKAGLGKLFSSGKANVILNLTSLAEIAEPVRKELLTLKEQGFAGRLVFASPIEHLGDTSTLDEAINASASKLANLLAVEANLTKLCSLLEQKKLKMEETLGGGAGSEDELKKLQQENSELKKRVLSLENEARKLLKARMERLQQKDDSAQLSNLNAAKAASKKVTDTEATADRILQEQGIL